MSLLDKVSLCITPNAYKENILYSVIPNTTLGDMDVVRATTATRVNEQGLIEVVPRNLLTYSNDFTNVVWVTGGYGNLATVIPNDIISPDGLMNGSKITFSAGVTQARLIQQTSVINGGIYQASIFVKYGNKNTIDFYCDASVIGLLATFNFTTKVLTASGVSNTIVTELPNGWFRLQYTYTAPSATSQIGFISGIGDDGFVYAYGGQVEQGTSATEYFPTTTRLNIPRIDYTNGSCPSLLVEPQRTNLATNSDGNLSTYPIEINVTNASSSFNSFTNAIQFPSTGVALAYKAIVTTAQTYSISVFIKMDDNSVPILSESITTGNFCLVIAGSIATNNLKVESLGNNIYRLSASATSLAGNVNNGLVRYDTQVLKSFKITGIQLEQGSYATSYIPTVASTVTRNADIISKTGISSLIGQTEGTVFVDFDFDTTNNTDVNFIFDLSDLTTSNRIFLYYFNNWAWGGSDTNISLPSTKRKKIAVRYISGTGYLYCNGTLISTLSLSTALNTLNIGSRFNNNFIPKVEYKSFQVYKTALSELECINLTTL